MKKVFLSIVLAMVSAAALSQTVIISEPSRFTWSPVDTDTSGAPVDVGRVSGYTAECVHATEAPVTLDFPGQDTNSADIAPGTFALGSWDCLLTAVDTDPNAPPALSAAATFVVTELSIFPLAAPGDFSIDFTTTPQ